MVSHLLKYWFITPATTLKILRQDDWQMCPAILDILFWGGIGVNLCFTPFTTIDLIFQKSLWISSLVRSLTVDIFPIVMMRLELRTRWFLDLISFTIQVCIAKTVMFPSWNLRPLSSSLFIAIIHVCARFHSVVVSEVFKP